MVVHIPLASFPKISRALFLRIDLCLLVFQFSINLINQGSTCLYKSETMALIVTPPNPQTFQTLLYHPDFPQVQPLLLTLTLPPPPLFPFTPNQNQPTPGLLLLLLVVEHRVSL